MTILDRERYWAFLKAYITCYVSLVGLYIVIDAFSNVDEFAKRAEGIVPLFQVMGRYYLVHQLAMFDMLSSVITMMAAIFAVTWVQKNNEMLAMLAAGISTHRIIRPVIISAIIVSSFSVINQEFIMPQFADELQKAHADDGIEAVPVSTRYDSNNIILDGKDADRASGSIQQFAATFDRSILGKTFELRGAQATFIPHDHPSAPLKGGWLIRGTAKIEPELTANQFEELEGLLGKVTTFEGYPAPKGDADKLIGDAYFLKSNITFREMTRKLRWYEYANSWELLRGLADSTTDAREAHDVALFIHFRWLRPLMSVTLLFMTLPLVLSGFGRNSFISLGLALGNSAMFYTIQLGGRFLGSGGLLTPEMASWGPLMGFAGLATLRWGKIRT